MRKTNKCYVQEDGTLPEILQKYKSTFLFSFLQNSNRLLLRLSFLSLTFPILFIKRYYPFQLCCVTKICVHFLSFWRIFVQNHISLKFDIFWSDENNCNGVWQNVVTFNSYTYIIQVITWVICINILGYITLYEITKK